MKIDFSRPGKPTDNAYIESFIGNLRDECLNGEIFYSLKEAQAEIEQWRVEYNTRRPLVTPRPVLQPGTLT